MVDGLDPIMIPTFGVPQPQPVITSVVETGCWDNCFTEIILNSSSTRNIIHNDNDNDIYVYIAKRIFTFGLQLELGENLQTVVN